MSTDEVVVAVINLLNQQSVPYMIVGSLATNYYCVPRSTQDGDIVVQAQSGAVARQISQQYSELRFDPQLGFELVTGTQKALLRTADQKFEIELFELSSDAHDQERFSRRVQVPMLGESAWVATLEDMIVTKLRWSKQAGREKDLTDARNLIAVQSGQVDWPYVQRWCDLHGTRPVLDRLRQELSP